MHYGWWIVLRQDYSHQDTFYKVLAGHKDMEAMAAVFHTCLQDLQRQQSISYSLLCLRVLPLLALGTHVFSARDSALQQDITELGKSPDHLPSKPA